MPDRNDEGDGDGDGDVDESALARKGTPGHWRAKERVEVREIEVVKIKSLLEELTWKIGLM